MFTPGPFSFFRHIILDKCKEFIKTGDILYRQTNVMLLGFIPFSRLVSYFSDSKYSHASIAMVEGEDIYVMEVNDQGTLKMRLIDWVDYCKGESILVCRIPGADMVRLEVEVSKFLAEDPDYDFLFDDDNKYYCTESVVYLYEKIGIKLMEPKLIKEITPWWFYYPFLCGNFLMRKFMNAGFEPDMKCYFAGNESVGMLAYPGCKTILEFSLVNSDLGT